MRAGGDGPKRSSCDQCYAGWHKCNKKGPCARCLKQGLECTFEGRDKARAKALGLCDDKQNLSDAIRITVDGLVQGDEEVA